MGQPGAGERESRHFQQHDHKPEQRNHPIDACAKSEHFLLKVDNIHIDNVKRDNLGASRGEPAASGGARNTSPSCMSDVSRRSDEIAKTMIIAAQNSSRGRHDSIITAVAPTATRDKANTT